MAAQSNITLNTSDVYVPSGRDANGVATWHDRSDSSAYPAKITLSVSNSPNQQGNYKVTAKLTRPKLVAEDSPCGCAGSLIATPLADISVTVSSKLTSAERTALWTSIKDLVAHAVFETAIEDLTGAW